MNDGAPLDVPCPRRGWCIFWLAAATLVGGGFAFYSMFQALPYAPWMNLVPMVASGALAFTLIRRAIQRWQEPIVPTCPKCRYCMSHLDKLECPECGFKVSSVAAWSRRRRRGPVAMCVFAAVIVPYTLFLACSTSVVIWQRHLIAAKLESLRAAGLPTNGTELNAWYVTPPPGENAADVYAQAANAYDAKLESTLPWFSGAAEPPATDPFPPALLAAYEAYLASNQRSLELLDKATKMPRARFDVDYANANFGSHFGAIRKSAILLFHAAKVSVIRGDGARTADNIVAIIHVADSLRSEPTAIALLIRIANRELTVDALEFAMTRMDLQDADAMRLERELSRSRSYDDETIQRAGIGECAIDDQTFIASPALLLGLLKPKSMTLFDLIFYGVSGARDVDRRICLDIYAGLPAACGLRGKARLDAVQDSVNQTSNNSNLCFISRACSSNFLATFKMTEKSNAQIDAARVALAVHRFRHTHGGEVPASLAELVPDFLDAIPEDPFDGKPMKYARLPRGFAVYIASSGKDDSVALLQSTGALDTSDTGIVVKR